MVPCCKSFFQKSILVLLAASVVAVLALGEAYAGTLFTYSGTGIQSKASVSQSYVSGSNCTVKHTQTKVYSGASYGMKVSIQKDQGWGNWSTAGSKTFYNNVSGSTFSTYCSSGTYRLWFETTNAGYKFNISGSFYN